ncbi:DNA/RNA non-specific endonuclease [Streptomyces javensis]|uniref:DNA/RNA non-specific endonuclease n=1 Tax=Streptomyces javensis TaxID=114698 RepID=UPI0033E6024A
MLGAGQVSHLAGAEVSVVFRPDRRLAAATAVTIDGAHLIDVPREDEWRFDPRVPEAQQAGHPVYQDNPLDKGHSAPREAVRQPRLTPHRRRIPPIGWRCAAIQSSSRSARSPPGPGGEPLAQAEESREGTDERRLRAGRDQDPRRRPPEDGGGPGDGHLRSGQEPGHRHPQ